MISYEKVTLKQIPFLVKLAKEIWREYSICFITKEQIEYMLKKFQSQNAIKEQLENNYEYYFIKKRNINVGYFAIQPLKDKLFLSKLYIKKDFRNLGVGKQTIEFIKQNAVQKKLSAIELTVNKTNFNSIKAYEKIGFLQKTSIISDIGNGFVMDDYVFVLKIKN